jgi:CRP/FNR family transcriptional regulator, cyclic AMP receptor protein
MLAESRQRAFGECCASRKAVWIAGSSPAMTIQGASAGFKEGHYEMSLVHDPEVWKERLAALPLARYEAGETVFAEGTKTGRLLILKSGAVSIFKGDIEFAQVAEPGAVFGELSALLDEPHSADVRTLETSEFHLADAATLLQDPAALLYVTMVLARRIDTANQGLLQLKIMLQAGEPKGLIDKTLDGIEGLLSAIGAGYIRAGAGASGYPFT